MTWLEHIDAVHRGNDWPAVFDATGPVSGRALIGKAVYAAELLTTLESRPGRAVPALLTVNADALAPPAVDPKALFPVGEYESIDSAATQASAATLAQSVAIAAVFSIPALGLQFSGIPANPVLSLVIYGAAVIGASFLLAWAAEAAQIDVSGGLAVAVLAPIAVLPE
jgi:hypothetical protein